jgi:hypothetical protein
VADKETTETWWTVKYIDTIYRPPRECRTGAAYAYKRDAERDAERFRALKALNVRVVPCDPPRLRVPLKELNPA